MTDKDKGFSRLGRVVAVIGVSLGLVVVSTTPSQAFAPTALLTPASALPTTIVAGGAVSFAGATGTAVGATVCAATIYCGLAVVAGLVIIGGGAGLIWKWEDRPNTDIVEDGSVNWVAYPYKDPYGPYVDASYRFGDKPEALKEYPGTNNVRHCVVVQNKETNAISLTNCNEAGNFVKDDIRPGGTEKHHLVYNEAIYNAVGFAVQLWVGGSITSKVWELALIDKIMGGTVNIPATPEFTPTPKTIPEIANPDRRVRIKTRCTRNDGTHYYVITYSTIYKQTDAQRPEIVAAVCTQNETDYPSGFDAGEEKKDPDTDIWTPTIINPGAEDPGTIIIAELPNPITDPNYQFHECLVGSVTCVLDVGKIQPDGTVESCATADCTDIEDWVKPNAPTVNNPYRCTYNGVSIAQSECTPLVPDIINEPTTTPTTNCGITDIQCWLDKIFLPNPETVDEVMDSVRDTWEDSVFGRIPTIIGGFSAPFMTPGVFEPTQGNCDGPTITLPKNMGIDGVGVSGDYSIKPLKACDGLAKTVSEYWRAIATPTVFVTGGLAVVNTLLSAVGLSLKGIRGDGD